MQPTLFDAEGFVSHPVNLNLEGIAWFLGGFGVGVHGPVVGMPEVEQVACLVVGDACEVWGGATVVPKHDAFFGLGVEHPPHQPVGIPVETIGIETFGGIVVLYGGDGFGLVLLSG